MHCQTDILRRNTIMSRRMIDEGALNAQIQDKEKQIIHETQVIIAKNAKRVY